MPASSTASRNPRAFLNDGGLGILVGDGHCRIPGLEQIIETYYLFPIYKWNATIDYQFVVNPAYNRDRGPVSIIGVRQRRISDIVALP